MRRTPCSSLQCASVALRHACVANFYCCNCITLAHLAYVINRWAPSHIQILQSNGVYDFLFVCFFALYLFWLILEYSFW
uniref:Uncharacterized protein n=1 Tax=Pygocentrus nattereri TaxID=42514 RepID=A0AAR2JIT1_PYGNA